MNKRSLSLIFGVLAFFLSWSGFGFIFGIPGLIFGMASLKSPERKKSRLVSGKYLSYVAIVLNLFSISMLLATIYLEIIKPLLF